MEHGIRTTPQQPSPAQHALPVAIAYDNHGTRWGINAPANAEDDIARARAVGTTVDEWETTDRAGQPLRIARIPDASWLDTIYVFTTEDTATVTA